MLFGSACANGLTRFKETNLNSETHNIEDKYIIETQYMGRIYNKITLCPNERRLSELGYLTYLWIYGIWIKRDTLKDSNRDKTYGCLNCGHRYSEITAQVGTILYCKVCHKYEQIVYVSDSGISTSERLEKDELFELLSEGRIKLVDTNDIKSNN